MPELQRDWVSRDACGLEWQVGRRRVYPFEMSCLRGHWPEMLNPTFDRRLTARPAVLAKNVRSRAVIVPVPTVDGPDRTSVTLRFELHFLDLIGLRRPRPHAIPAVFTRVRRRGADAVSTRFRPLALAR
jgi:hypothetical protein